MAAMDHADDGATVEIPGALAGGPSFVGSNILPNNTAELVGTVRRLAGRQGLVVTDGNMGKALVAADDGLPSDFAPVIILDASGRVRTTYEFWGRHRDDLVWLPAAANDYRHLDVRLWQRTSGKTAMLDRAVRDDILRGLAEVINEEGDDGWLVIHYKQDQTFEADLKSRVVNRPDRVRCTHWGNHHGTNEFREAANVALVGGPTYRRSGYMALGLASGVPATELPSTLTQLQDGEKSHHYLQAACRGAFSSFPRRQRIRSACCAPGSRSAPGARHSAAAPTAEGRRGAQRAGGGSSRVGVGAARLLMSRNRFCWSGVSAA